MNFPERDPLDSVAEEFADRLRRGECPEVDEYAEKFPEWAQEIREVLPTVASMEELKLKRRHESGKAAAQAEISVRSLERLGEFRILREAGRGGMGVVFEAEQQSLGRRVALKVLSSSTLLGTHQRERFEREAQAAARLHHTNIVPVFGVGEADGFHYYVMQFIDGRGLNEVVAELRSLRDGKPGQGGGTEYADSAAMLPGQLRVADLAADLSSLEFFHAVARIGVQVADALQYAHDQGVLHRDVKPANLLLDGRGTVWVTDFGLAKLAEKDDLTKTGDIIGTLHYMAPEYFHGKGDTRSDLYGLGLCLYELLTLKPPFEASTPARLMKKVTETRPADPHVINPAVPRDLETIVLKAMAAAPRDRYQTARELADDLEAFVDDRPIQARRASYFEHAWRWCRRNPALAAVGSTAALLLVLVALGATAGYFARTRHLRNVEELKNRAVANLVLAKDAFEEIFSKLAPATDSVEEWSEEETPSQPVVSRATAAVLDELLQFYSTFANENADDPELRSEMAAAHRRVGDIHERLGGSAEAGAAYGHAVETYRRLLDEAGADEQLSLALADTLNDLAQSYRWREGRKRREIHTEALEVLDALNSDSTTARFARARTHFYLAPGRRRMSRPRRGQAPPEPRAKEIEHLRTARDLLEGLVGEDPERGQYQFYLARTQMKVAEFDTSARGDPESVQSEISRALEMLESLRDRHPGNLEYLDGLAHAYMDSTSTLTPASEERGVRIAQALEIGEDLVKRYPEVPRLRGALTFYHERYARWYERRKDFDRAVEQLRRAISQGEGLSREFSSSIWARAVAARTKRRLADVLTETGDLPEARALLEDSIRDLESLMDGKELGGGRAHGHLARLYEALEKVLEKQGETKLAAEAGARADEERKKAPQRPQRGRGRGEPPETRT